MPFIDKNENGDIIGIYASSQYDGQEYTEEATLHIEPQQQEYPEQFVVRDSVTGFPVKVVVENGKLSVLDFDE